MAQVEQRLRTSVQLKRDIEDISVGFICIEGKTYDIHPAVTACIIDILDEIDELENLLLNLKHSDNVARS